MGLKLIQRVRSRLASPVFADVDKTLNASHIHTITWFLAACLVIYTISRLLIDVRALTAIQITTIGLIFIWLSGTLLVNHLGAVRLAGLLLVFPAWIIFNISAYLTGGVGTAGFAGNIIIIFLAGLLFGFRMSLLITAGSTLFGFWMVIQQKNDLLPLSYPLVTPEANLATLTALFLLATVLLQITIRRIRKSLKKAVIGEQRFRELYEQAADGIAILDQEGVILAINSAGSNLLGFTPAELIGQNALALVLPQESALISQKVDARVEPGEVFRGEYSVSIKDGTRLILLANLRRMPDHQFQLSFTDITERKQNEIRLHEQKEAFRVMFDENPYSITISDLQTGKYVDVNRAYRESIGLSREKIIGKTVLQLNQLLDPDKNNSLTEKIRTSGGFTNEEIYLRDGNNNLRICLAATRTIHLKEQTFALSSYEDITDRKHAEETLIASYDATLQGWARALELRERETAGHSRRVVQLTIRLAKAMGLSGEPIRHIRRGVLLHDIGKLAIPDSILFKPAPLNEEEWIIMRQHPLFSFNLLSGIEYLAPAMDIPCSHHEHWDGSGYPNGLTGDQIPLAARIFAVIDVWDALTSDRPYRPALSKEDAKEFITQQSGKHFDPRIVEVFIQLIFNPPAGTTPNPSGQVTNPLK
jgi:PAS domain S-box-containing protein